jgi:hypothetical protein
MLDHDSFLQTACCNCTVLSAEDVVSRTYQRTKQTSSIPVKHKCKCPYKTKTQDIYQSLLGRTSIVLSDKYPHYRIATVLFQFSSHCVQHVLTLKNTRENMIHGAFMFQLALCSGMAWLPQNVQGRGRDN